MRVSQTSTTRPYGPVATGQPRISDFRSRRGPETGPAVVAGSLRSPSQDEGTAKGSKKQTRSPGSPGSLGKVGRTVHVRGNRYAAPGKEINDD